MILKHQKFDFAKKCLIEKISIKAPFKFVTHFQNEACFIYFLEGKTKINSPQEQQIVQANESVLLKCGSYFADLLKYSTADRYEILVFHLYPDVLREIYTNEIPNFIEPTKRKSYFYTLASSEIITKFAEGLQFYFDNPQLVSDELLKLKIKELILLLLQTKNGETIKNLFADLFTPRNLSIKEVVSNHLFTDLSIEDLATLCNLSVSTFNRTFQNLFNDTPANYIKTKRLEKAKELLTVSALTIREIAFQTCFNDIAHFSRSFKTAYQCTPSQFRLSLKKQ